MKSSPVKNGLVLVVTAHTTTGIIVNERLPCVEDDIQGIYLVELDGPQTRTVYVEVMGE